MNVDELQFFDPRDEVRMTENRLPHWEQQERTYFLTFRTADSIPAGVAGAFHDELDAWLAWHPKPWDEKTEREYWTRFGQRTEQWLDESHGACLLRQPGIAAVVAGALGFHEGKSCTQHAWVVMPNHIHAVCTLLGDATLGRLLHSWKSFTASEINRRTGASGAFWQKDYFDRLIRSAEHFWRCVRYIRKNPANLRPGEYLVWESPEVAQGLAL